MLGTGEFNLMKKNKFWLNIIEYSIMNNDWEGWRMARIEVHQEGHHYAIYEGFIRLPDRAFEVLRKKLDMKEFNKLPYLRFDVDEENLFKPEVDNLRKQIIELEAENLKLKNNEQ